MTLCKASRARVATDPVPLVSPTKSGSHPQEFRQLKFESDGKSTQASYFCCLHPLHPTFLIAEHGVEA